MLTGWLEHIKIIRILARRRCTIGPAECVRKL